MAKAKKSTAAAVIAEVSAALPNLGTFAAQTPKSRTLHYITNVTVEPGSDDPLTVHSNQLIMELRTGDYRQVGLGLLRLWPDLHVALLRRATHGRLRSFQLGDAGHRKAVRGYPRGRV